MTQPAASRPTLTWGHRIVVNWRYERGRRTAVTSNHGLLPPAAPDGEPAWLLRRYELVVADKPQSCELGCPVRPASSSAMASVIALG